MAKKYVAKLMTETKVKTGKCRLSYAHLFEKYEKSDKYQCQLLIPKSDKESIAVIKQAIEAAKANGKSRLWGGKLPGSYRGPLNDGDTMEEPSEAYEGMYYINAKSNRKPQVVDLDRDDIFDAEEVYSGCYVRATIVFFPYSNEGKGVGVLLNNVQKLADGDHLGGSAASAADDFDDDEELEDDELLD